MPHRAALARCRRRIMLLHHAPTCRRHVTGRTLTAPTPTHRCVRVTTCRQRSAIAHGGPACCFNCCATQTWNMLGCTCITLGTTANCLDASVTQVLYGALVGGPGNTTDYSGEWTQLELHQTAIAGCACVKLAPLHPRVPCKLQPAAQPTLVARVYAQTVHQRCCLLTCPAVIPLDAANSRTTDAMYKDSRSDYFGNEVSCSLAAMGQVSSLQKASKCHANVWIAGECSRNSSAWLDGRSLSMAAPLFVC